MNDTHPQMCEPGFKVTLLKTSEEVPVVSAFGEIDISSADGLKTVIHEAISRLRDRVEDDGGNVNGCMILDLGGVDFIDSVGLSVLLEARRELLKVSNNVPSLVCPEEVGGILELAGLTDSFDLYSDLESAVAGCSAGETEGS